MTKSVYYILVFIVVMMGCQNHNNSTSLKNDIVEIDIEQGLKRVKNITLSDLVDSIEYIKTETGPDFLVSPGKHIVGQKYVVFSSMKPSQILLFSRTGAFIRKIGKQGKGPGEFNAPRKIDLSPDETKIIIHNWFSLDLIEYSIEGDYIQTIKCMGPLEKGPYYLDNNTVVYLQGRPFVDSTFYPRLISMDLVSQKKTILAGIDHKKESEGDVYYNNILARNDHGILYRDCMSDTVFQVTANLGLLPIVVLNHGGNRPPAFMVTKENDNYDYVETLVELPNHLLLKGRFTNSFFQIYEAKTSSTFTLPKQSMVCEDIVYDFGIINDLDGVSPIWNSSANYIRNNTISEKFEVIDIQGLFAKSCFPEAELVSDNYWNILSSISNTCTIDDNPIIRVLHLKR